jgi:7-carboxy-7-deazaguanine synthase
MKKIVEFMKNNILELYTAIQSEGSRAGRPTVVIRTSGCTHRCYFGEGGWCDSWYTSIHPEKAKWSFSDVVKMYDENPQISEMMITGGSPTMFPELLNQLTEFAFNRGIITTIETEGSHFVETEYKIDLVSLSPKFSNSVPKLGVMTPKGNIVDQKFIDTHNRFRLNYEAIGKMIGYHNDYHFKPVWNGDDSILEEIENFRVKMNIPKDKTWLMPAGDTREQLIKMYPIVMEKAVEIGYNFSSREHIIAYDIKRGV